MNLNTFKVRKEPRVIVKYDPIPFWAVKKMMRGNAASLMAGGEAVYINFDTRLMSCHYITALWEVVEPPERLYSFKR